MNIILLDEGNHSINISGITKYNSVLDYLKNNYKTNSSNNIFIIHTSDSIWEQQTITQIDKSFRTKEFLKYDNLMMFLYKYYLTNRFIFFSGGTTSYKNKINSYSYQNLFEDLSNTLQKEKHWIPLSISQVESSLDWDKIKIGSINNETFIKDFIKESKEKLNFLIVALDMLIQGYLAIQAPKYLFGGESNIEVEAQKVIKENNLFANGKEVAEKRTAFDKIVNSKNNLEDPEPYWFDVLREEVEKINTIDLKIKYNLKKDSSILLLWKILRGDCSDKGDGVKKIPKDQESWTKLVLSVHKECHNIMIEQKKSLIEEFENKRSLLNHDLVKNAFLLKMGELNKNLDLKTRSMFIYDYLKHISNEKVIVDEVFQARYESVVSATKRWPEVKSKVESFLLNDINEFEFEPTAEFENLRNQLIGIDDCIVNRIDMFINNIKSYVHLTDDELNKNLFDFWKNADDLHQLISALHMIKLPNKYFDIII